MYNGVVPTVLGVTAVTVLPKTGGNRSVLLVLGTLSIVVGVAVLTSSAINAVVKFRNKA